MTAQLEVTYRGQPTVFRLEPIDRQRLLGDTRLVAMDADGNECRTALLTLNGQYLLLPGSTAAMYVDADGNWLDRGTLTRSEESPSQAVRAPGPVELEGPIAVQELLDGVTTRIHRLDYDALHPALAAALQDGAVFRLKGPGTGGSINLFANDAGIFLVHADACGFGYVGPDQVVTESEFGDDDDATDTFGFDDAREVQR